MKYSKILISIFLIIAFYFNTYSQSEKYPFEVQKLGQGEQSIIFIHGFGCSGAVWNETVAKFAKDYTCYVLSISGFAGLAPQPNPSLENWKNAIVNFILDNNIDKPIIVGHSMGGMLTLSIAMDYPDLPLRIIDVDGYPCEAILNNPDFIENDTLDCTIYGVHLADMDNEDFINSVKQEIESQLDNKQMLDIIVNWEIQSDKMTFGKIYCELMNFDRRKDLKKIICPSLILINNEIANTLQKEVWDQFKNLKNATIRFAKKGNHFIMYDDKDWYFVQLNDFIRNY